MPPLGFACFCRGQRAVIHRILGWKLRPLQTASRLDDGQGLVVITVCDSGVGVSESELTRIFEPFVTTKSQGLGMGLAISRSIVEAHKGRIWASRNEDQGLTIHIELPI